MNLAAMRKALLDAYPGQKWRDKIKKANDDQIFAMYTRLKLAGRIK